SSCTPPPAPHGRANVDRRRARAGRARRDRGRALSRPVAPDRVERDVRAAAGDPVRRPPGARRRALDARRHDGRLSADRARRDPAHPQVSRRAIRSLLALPAVGCLGALLAWGNSGLAPFGHFTPGGGFQGGVAIASGVAVLFLTAGCRSWRRIAKKEILDPFEGGGAGAYVALGVAALISGAPFLHNLLGGGQTGTLVSG